jgi:hypothetical protein
MNEKTTGRVHWSFWIVGAVALIWNLMSVQNFLGQMNPESLAAYPEAARVLVGGRPVWSTGAFAIAAFGGGLGCILLLLRKAAAFHLFVASFAGVIVTTGQTLASTSDVPIWTGSLMSVAVGAFLIWYSKRCERQGWIN